MTEPWPGRERKLDGQQEAHLIAFACSAAPAGHTHWTLQLLADKVVELEFAESISLETVRQLLKKNELKPWKKKEWCIPKVSGEFVARMEDVLDLYHQAYHPERPVVCFDETSRQLTGEVRPPLAAAPGRVARYDTEYQRNGTRNRFMICEPKGGWRHVAVTERRTAVDFAHRMRWLVEARPTLMPRWSGWYWTTSTPTSSARSTKHLSRAKPGASRNASSFITLLRMAAG